MSHEPIDRRLLLATAGFTGAALAARAARGGPLDPPAGPVAPTGRTLDEIFDKVARTDAGLAEPRIPISSTTTPGGSGAVYEITAPGSYYLRENLLPVGFQQNHALRISASNVSLDLQGFSIVGTSGALQSNDGINIAQGIENIRIHAGFIGGCNGSGIEGPSAAKCIVHDVCVVNCAEDGVRVGDAGAVFRCQTVGNGFTGVRSGRECVVSECASTRNGAGISLGEESLVAHCAAKDNDGHGIALRTRCRAIGNTAMGNGFGSAANFCGIIAFGSQTDGLIDSNFVVNNELGVCVSGLNTTGWTVVRNVAKASQLSNYSIVAGNHAGAIVSNPASAGPWDNISN